MASWVAEEDLLAAGRVRLFCLPHAGSGAAGFYRWKRLLPAWVSVCPVQLPGREIRMAEAPLGSVEEMVAGLHAAVGARLGERPYAVFGHSMGALVGFEWVRRIEADGFGGPVRLIVSGRVGPQLEVSRGLSGLGDEDFLRALERRYGGGTALLEDAELRALFLPVLRADLGVVEGYRFRCGVRAGVTAMAGVEDGSVPEEGLRAWGEVCGAFRAERMPGGHFYTFGVGQGELLRVLEGELRGGLG